MAKILMLQRNQASNFFAANFSHWGKLHIPFGHHAKFDHLQMSKQQQLMLNSYLAPTALTSTCQNGQESQVPVPYQGVLLQLVMFAIFSLEIAQL